MRQSKRPDKIDLLLAALNKEELQDYRITGKLPRARLTFARPPRCVTGVEVVENVDVNGVGVDKC